MNKYTVNYQIQTAPKTFYYRWLILPAKNIEEARRKAEKILAVNTDFSNIEAVLITDIEIL